MHFGSEREIYGNGNLSKKDQRSPAGADGRGGKVHRFFGLGEQRKTRAAAIASYVAKHAGTDADLDPELEAAAVEFLLQQDGE